MNDIQSMIEQRMMAADIVAAYVSNNAVSASALPELIASVHAAVANLGSTETIAPPVEKPTQAQIKRSITPEALVSFEDGKPYKTLKRHLNRHGMSAQDYRTKWGLPVDYPMVAQSYSAKRSELAKALGLGRPGRMIRAAA